jgi:hypothetical protein
MVDRHAGELRQQHRGLLIVLSVNSSAPCFSVRYRLPNGCPWHTIGTPRNELIGGCPTGNPYEKG